MPSSSFARFHFPAVSLAVASLVAVAWAIEPPFADLHRAPAISNIIDGVVFEAGNWKPHLTAGAKGESWGNHRAVVEVNLDSLAPGANVRVTIPWRRRDPDPEAKAVVVVDAATGQIVPNAIALRITNVEGELLC